MMDFTEFQRIVKDYSNLGAELLEKERVELTAELDQAQKKLSDKIKILHALDKEIAELEPFMDHLQNESNDLDVELIRARTQQKKLKKNLQKLSSLNASRTTVEVAKNDKLKLAKNKAKLHLMKSLTSTFVNNEGRGYVLNPSDLQLQAFQLNSRSKKANKDFLWEKIGQCTRFNDQWKQLF